MKYWRGYLVALVFAAFSWFFMKLGESYSTVVDLVYPYITRSVQTFLTQWSGSVDYLVWQLLALIAILILLATIVLMILLRWNPIQWFGWVLAAASIVFFLHTGIYGLNYFSGPLAEDIRLEMMDYVYDELKEATIYYRDKANALASQVKRDGNQDPIYDSFEVLAEKCGDGFRTLVYEDMESVFCGSLKPVKKLGFHELYTSMGITGFTFPLTGEAAVNPEIPVVSLPFTMGHEMAHRMSIANEEDASFAGFLACQANQDIQFQYSAYFMAYSYCYNTLYYADRQDASLVNAGCNELLKHDLDGYNQFFTAKRNEKATKLADTVNDTYIKTSGDQRGTLAYGAVTDELVSWYYQMVVKPSLQENQEAPAFNPYDKNAVDLSGIVNALPKEG